MNEHVGIKVLVIHPFAVMADIIRFFVESEYNSEAMTCHSVFSAQEAIEQEKYFDIIIAASTVALDDALPFFIKFSEEKKSPTLIFVEHKRAKLPSTFRDLSVKAFIKEDNMLEDLNELFIEILVTDTSKTPEDWTKVSLPPLAHFESLPEDVFIKLITGRMLKLFRQGDNLNEDDIERYSKKGVRNLYIQRQAFLWMLKQIDKIIPTIEQDKLINIESSNLTSEPSDEPFKIDIPLPLEENFVKEVHEKSKKVLDEMRKNKDLAVLLKMLDLDRDPKSYFKNRINLVCTISCALAKDLAWSSDAMFEKFIYVAHMHDLTLIKYPKLTRLQHHWQIDVMPNITEEEKKLFLNHPQDVARLVSLDPRAPTEAEMMIRQHHERANGKGFPEKLQSARIMPTAALIQVAIDFAQYILENPKWTYESYIGKNGALLKGGPFTKILKSLENVCKGKI